LSWILLPRLGINGTGIAWLIGQIGIALVLIPRFVNTKILT
jgi:hypothetical protein